MICHFEMTDTMLFPLLFSFVVSQAAGENLTQFICNDGKSVIVSNICDGKKDCVDGSDEVHSLCSHILCPPETFRCFYGGCISTSLQCDGVEHCADGSDENQCSRKSNACGPNKFRCDSGECISFDKLCDGKNDCANNNDETHICKQITICPPNTHRCRVGGCISLSQICNGHNDCIDGSDESKTLCAAQNCIGQHCNSTVSKEVFCHPIPTQRIAAHCEIPVGPNKGVVPCDKPLPPGTIMHYECKPYYVPASSKHKNNKQMVCQFDGTWNREFLRCVPDCGVSEPDVAPLITNGWTTERGKFAWHAVLYNLQAGNWTFICGGTLITEKIVLTAAHCTWNMDKSMLQVALGKYSTDFYEAEDSAQARNISKIIRQTVYQDLNGNYGSDIAILVLKEPVEFSPVIRPACIDWNLDDITEHLVDNNLGIVVGMGITENNTFSQHLRATYLPVVDEGDCLKKQKKDFRKYITYTSFCAGWRNGSGVCNGDSGGGLLFLGKKQSKRFTLQGIVSISPRRPGTSFCDPRYYTIFTKVGMYVEWIYDKLREIHDDVKYDTDVVW